MNDDFIHRNQTGNEKCYELGFIRNVGFQGGTKG